MSSDTSNQKNIVYNNKIINWQNKKNVDHAVKQ